MAVIKSSDKENSNPQLENSKESIIKHEKPVSEPVSNHQRYNEVMNMNVKELRKEIKCLGLEGTGLKRDLQYRLLHHNADNDKGTESDEEGDHGPVMRGVVVDVAVKSPDIKRMSTDSMKDIRMDDVVDEKANEKMEVDTISAEKVQVEKSSGPQMSKVQLAVALREGKLAQLKEHKKPSETSSRKNHITMGVQTFVKNAVRALSPSKRLKECGSTGAPNQNTTARNSPVGNATTNAIAMTTSTFMSTNSNINVSFAPQSDSSATISEKPIELISSVTNSIPSIVNNSISESSSTTPKIHGKSQQLADARKQRLADMRGKSKPVASTVSSLQKVIMPLQPIKLLNKSSTTKTGLELKKQTLASKMREKHATLQTQPVLVNQYSEPFVRNLQSSIVAIEVVAAIETDKENNAVICPRALEANSPGAKKEAQEMKTNSLIDTYEISDRDQSESESDSDEDESKAKKKVRVDLSKLYP